MSFKALLKIGEKELNVIRVSYNLYQETTVKGSPSSEVRGGKVYVSIESEGNSFFFEWMTDSFERKKGSIVFFKTDSEAKLKELFFEDAYLVDYTEDFQYKGSNTLTENFIISARKIFSGDGELENEWPN